MDLTGRTLKHYKIEGVLGKGGMGIVYRARDTRLDRPVALKLLKPGLIADPDRKARFLREARAAAALTHPAIAQVYDIDEDGETTFIAMECIDGRTVSRLIADRELDLTGAVEIALQIAEGLSKAHQRGIIHRDIKSDNIMVTRDGHAKILDFGLAKLLEPGPTGTESPPAGLPDSGRTMTLQQAHTIAGAVMGTVNYMSPEQARGQELDPRTDIFSLGVVFYEMVTSERPFQADTFLDTMHSIAYEEPKPVTEVRKNLPPRLQTIISRCLRKRREDRYPDAQAFADDLKHLKHDIETGSGFALPLRERLAGWTRRIETSFPFGKAGPFLLAALIVLVVLSIFIEIPRSGILSTVLVGLFIYRWLRNRKRRMLASFTRKISSDPSVKAVIFRNDEVTVITDKAQAKTYIRITSLIESINKRLFVGSPVSVSIRDNLADLEVRPLLQGPGILYVRGDLPSGPSR